MLSYHGTEIKAIKISRLLTHVLIRFSQINSQRTNVNHEIVYLRDIIRASLYFSRSFQGNDESKRYNDGRHP